MVLGGTRAFVSALTHRQRVRLLYRSILRLHKGLPGELKLMGDQYVKDEFKRHKDASMEHVGPFMIEWSKYLRDLSTQLGPQGIAQGTKIGQDMPTDMIDEFSNEQIMQLYELKTESEKAKKNL